MRWRYAAIAIIAAAAVPLIALYKIATGERITLPQHVAWTDAAGKPFQFEDYDTGPCDGLMDHVLVLGDRLIVPCSREQYATGYAWIEPRTGRGQVAWPLPPTLKNPWLEGIAARDDATFAVVLTVSVDGKRAFVVGVAGHDGWLVAPTQLATFDDRSIDSGRPLLLGMGWTDGAIEVVLTHPTAEDMYGAHQPPDVVRVAKAGAPVTTSHPVTPCAACRMAGALQSAHGWKLVMVDDMAKGGRAMLVDEAGAATDVPPALAWWAQFTQDTQSDRTALGTLWGIAGKDAQVVERDGSRHPPPASPIAGWHEVVAFHRFEREGEVLRNRALYSVDDNITVLARVAAGRTLLTAHIDEDLQLVGDSVEHLHPILQASASYEFKVGAFLPGPDGGLYWVISSGDYVTLDKDLRRTDPQPLLVHLRTRGSTGAFIHEPGHVAKLFLLLLALPVALAIACVVSLVTRRWLAKPFLALAIVALILEIWAFGSIGAML